MIKKILGFVFGGSVVVASLIFCVQLVVFDKNFYLEVYEQLDLAQEESISQQDLEESIFMMIDYVEGSRQDLEGTILWKGQSQSTFNEKEISHMADVRTLWQNARKVMYACLGIMVLCAGLLAWKAGRHALAFISRGLIAAIASFYGLLLVLGVWILTDFNGFWNAFHHVFFTNNLWLLNPATDFMIVICPEELFYKMVIKIVLLFLTITILLQAFGVYYIKKKAVIGFENI